ncbi:MAG: tyrosine-type recombinase/integrase [Melioribacteraceae bacterium]
MAAIKQLKNGKYYTTVYDLGGKRYRIRFEKYKYAKAFVDRIEKEKSDHKLISVGLMNRKSLIENSIEEYLNSKNGLRNKSIIKYTRVMDQFRNFCIDNKIQHTDEFTRAHADKLFSVLSKSGAEAKTINFYLMSIKALFIEEVNRDRLRISPFSHIKSVKEKTKSLIEREQDYYDENEIKNFFKVTMHESYRNVFQTLLLTGMRIAELISLRWEKSIDMQNKIIIVRSFENFSTKTDSSERFIPMTDLVYDMLLNIHTQNNVGNVFTDPKGKPVSERTFLKKCKEIAESAGITKNATLKMWRDSFASHVLNTQIKYEERQYLMGHSPESMTDRYTKVDPKKLHNKLSVLDKLIK